MVRVTLRGVVKRFPGVVALDKVDLDIKDGEFMVILGPSGCGKTTLLRCIAGLERVDDGRIYFDDEDVTDMPPYKRGASMVFQNYALWPHMTVWDNIAYGLKIRKLPKQEIERRVRWALRLVKLEGLENRYPTQLSGGQQQRVALARALVVEPKVLLLDEPLSNLDAKLRIEMREELRKLQRELGITTIYVTHDQEEAMVLADRIAVMNRGRIMQVGTPYELYRRPRNLFVATFLGKASLLFGKLLRQLGPQLVEVNYGGERLLGSLPAPDIEVDEGDHVALLLRPESLKLLLGEAKPGPKVNMLRGKVDWLSFIGERLEVRVKLWTGDVVIAHADPDLKLDVGAAVSIAIHADDLMVLPVRSMEEIAYAREVGLVSA